MVQDAKLRDLFRSLVSSLQAEITRRNEVVKNAGQRIQCHYDPQGKALVTIRSFPTLELSLWADEEARLIRYNYTTKRDKESNLQQSSPAQFRVITIGGNGLALVTGDQKINFEAATELLLTPFMSR